MVKKQASSAALSAEQQSEADLIYERIRGAFDQEARRLAELMASKATRDEVAASMNGGSAMPCLTWSYMMPTPS